MMQVSMPLLNLLIFAVLGSWASGQISDVFRDPEKACGLLEPEGFSAGELLFQPYGFECSAALEKKQSGSAQGLGFPNGSITYSVSGESIHRVSRIKIVLQLAPDADHSELIAQFQTLSEIVLARLSIELPKELPDAIKSTRYRRWQQKTGTVSFDPGRWPHTSRVLAVRHPGLRVVPIPRAVAARQSP